MMIWGQLLKAGLEHNSSNPATAWKGRMYWNTSNDVPMIYDGSNWIEWALFDSSGDLNFPNQRQINFYEQSGNGTNKVALMAPDSLASDIAFKLPNADGSTGQVMKTDGAGQLGWVSPLTNPMSNIGELIYGAASGTATALAAGTAGQILVSGGAGAPVWTTSYGSWTPTATGVTSITSVSAYGAMYIRLGNYVVFFLTCLIDPSSTGSWEVTIDKPIASTFTNTYNCTGVGQTQNWDNAIRLEAQTSGSYLIRIRGASTTDHISREYAIVGMYEVL